MATRADMMLMQALSQLGAGIGTQIGGRRRRKADEAFAEQMFPMTTPEDFMSEKDSELIRSVSSGVPGIGGMVGGAGMQGNQMLRATGQSGAANKEAELMRTMMQDPQAAAMMKQAKVQSMMPKPKQTKITSVSDGFVVQSGNDYEYIKTKSKTSKPSERYDTWNVGDKTYVVDYLTPDEDGNPTIIKEGAKGQLKLEEIGMGSGPDGESLKGLAVVDLVTKQSTPIGSSYRAGESNVRDMSVGEQKTRREKLTEVRDTLRDYQNIRELFKPEYLTLLGRGKTKGQGILDELGALDAFPEFFGRERFTDVKGFYSATQERANKYIKMITGAQMSEAEAKRLMKAIPSIEDSPNTFQAKLDYIVKVAQSSYEAYAFELASGASLEEAKMAGDAAVNQLMPSGVSLDRLLSGDVGGTPGFVED